MAPATAAPVSSAGSGVSRQIRDRRTQPLQPCADPLPLEAIKDLRSMSDHRRCAGPGGACAVVQVVSALCAWSVPIGGAIVAERAGHVIDAPHHTPRSPGPDAGGVVPGGFPPLFLVATPPRQEGPACGGALRDGETQARTGDTTIFRHPSISPTCGVRVGESATMLSSTWSVFPRFIGAGLLECHATGWRLGWRISSSIGAGQDLPLVTATPLF
jgi:hypothetical protein